MREYQDYSTVTIERPEWSDDVDNMDYDGYGDVLAAYLQRRRQRQMPNININQVLADHTHNTTISSTTIADTVTNGNYSQDGIRNQTNPYTNSRGVLPSYPPPEYNPSEVAFTRSYATGQLPSYDQPMLDLSLDQEAYRAGNWRQPMQVGLDPSYVTADTVTPSRLRPTGNTRNYPNKVTGQIETMPPTPKVPTGLWLVLFKQGKETLFKETFTTQRQANSAYKEMEEIVFLNVDNKGKVKNQPDW